MQVRKFHRRFNANHCILLKILDRCRNLNLATFQRSLLIQLNVAKSVFRSRNRRLKFCAQCIFPSELLPSFWLSFSTRYFLFIPMFFCKIFASFRVFLPHYWALFVEKSGVCALYLPDGKKGIWGVIIEYKNGLEWDFFQEFRKVGNNSRYQTCYVTIKMISYILSSAISFKSIHALQRRAIKRA